MSNGKMNDGKSKESAVDVNFEWGRMSQQDLSGQFTRSMMEIRKPKAYEPMEPPVFPNSKKMESPCEKIKIPSCSVTLHTIKLLKYIRQVQDLIAKIENRGHSMHVYSLQISGLSHPPVFESENPQAATSALRRSRSSSSGKSVDAETENKKYLFSAPEPDSDFRSGLKEANFPPLDERTASRILKRSVATIAAHTGYEESTSSPLNVLTGIAEAFMISFSKSLRDASDTEAETGRIAFFDCLDQVLHESGHSGMKDIQQFWMKRIVQRHQKLEKQAKKLSKVLQSMKYPTDYEAEKQIKLEKTQVFPTTYGKWTPVTGMSSSPFSSGRMTDTMSGASWMDHSEKLLVKDEPRDSYSFLSAGQSENARVKAEYGGFESTTRTPSIDLLNAGQTEDNFGLEDQPSLYAIDDYRPSKKKSRNM